ncbi:6-aminohexanoate-dimer hydrolase (plasmid) [Paracoccaceae bacterium]|nr:6-aminohexanoate-dimer hydrolase [Paracoccaceae bacterium]
MTPGNTLGNTPGNIPGKRLSGTGLPSDRTAVLGNWRTGPHNHWAFHNVSQLLTTQVIDRRPGDFLPLGEAPQDLGALAYDSAAGRRTVNAMLTESDTDGFLVLHDGKVAFEYYANGMSPSARHIMFSVSKSVLGMLFGILTDRGIVDPDQPVIDILPELRGSGYDTALLRHVLDMSVAVNFAEDYAVVGGDVDLYRRANGWDPTAEPIDHSGRDMLARFGPNGKEQGEEFHYVSPNTDVAAWIAERITGRSYGELLQDHLWQPMGAEYSAFMTVDRFGTARAAGGLNATLRDMGRIAMMMTDHAAVQGVVPKAFLDETYQQGDHQAWARSRLAGYIEGGRYRNKWYVKPGPEQAALAIGIHGQWLYVNRDKGVVIVKQSSQPLPYQADSDVIIMAAFDAIAREF